MKKSNFFDYIFDVIDEDGKVLIGFILSVLLLGIFSVVIIEVITTLFPITLYFLGVFICLLVIYFIGVFIKSLIDYCE